MTGYAFPLEPKKGSAFAKQIVTQQYFSNDFPANVPNMDSKRGYIFYATCLLYEHCKLIKVTAAELNTEIVTCKITINNSSTHVANVENELFILRTEASERDDIYQFWGFDKKGKEVPIYRIDLLSLFCLPSK